MGGTIDGARLKISQVRRARLGLWLLALLPLAVGFVLCYRPVLRLKTQPPADFAETQTAWDATRQSSENRAAQAYWTLAVNLVQDRFAYGNELPEEPIDEFRLAEKDFPRNSIAAAPATRVRYWNKLRILWPQREAWVRTYVWNTEWLGESLSKFTDAVRHSIEVVMSRFRK